MRDMFFIYRVKPPVIVFEGFQYEGIKMSRLGAAVPFGDDAIGPLMGEGGLVGPSAAQGVVNVHDTEHPAFERDFLLSQPRRIARAVPAFMVIGFDNIKLTSKMGF
jgi:hypothetical protein